METCSIDGCARRRKYKETGWCQTHYHRWWRQGDPLKKGSPRKTNPYELSYRSVHARNVELWGPATQHACIECGDPAAEWAYDGTDPTEKHEDIADRWPVRFSVHPEFYAPLCHPCHRGKDRSAWSARRTHCKSGHEMTPENTYTRPSRPGTRECQACRKQESRARYLAKRAL